LAGTAQLALGATGRGTTLKTALTAGMPYRGKSRLATENMTLVDSGDAAMAMMVKDDVRHQV
jgi:hypothetical protein